ncbi:ATP-dependent DNA helicase PIF1-like [Neltuma alba]|uniref:ATP-dependent DNA helicase PIF1-like n=1 Tax=Neltuma alba TaxID=207710 RepID=UPI0010A46393|nr:ATP-dependent DNA helicase PIF1-like [Prosopis alba]
MSGLPNHALKLKVGVPVILIWNIDKSNGLCNGTRLIVIRLEKYVIIFQMLSDTVTIQTVMIPRMTITPSDFGYPFTLYRHQFPLTLSFTMMINKSQGQSLHNIGLFLSCPVFTMGSSIWQSLVCAERVGLKF